MRFQAQRGTEDVLPGDSHKWLRLEAAFRELTRRYGYQEIRTPTFEDTNLFVRTSGETSDIVSKEMYTFKDKGDRDITLKPEGTAPAMRALIEHSLCPPGTIARLSYITPIFRYGRPQKGRLRESHQVGLELVGSQSPTADAEVIEITYRFYESIGIDDAVVMMNSIGRDECRARYREAILNHLDTFLKGQTTEVQERTAKNPLRILDSKDPDTRTALEGLPPILDFLEDEAKASFDRLQEILTKAAVPYQIAPEVVRGLDYYTDTVFEVLSSKLGAQSSLCGGGRYDNLVKDLGGSPTPSVGVAMGMERALIVLDEIGKGGAAAGVDVFLVQGTDAGFDATQEIAQSLRKAGLAALTDLDARSMKSQLRQADKAGARFVIIIGEDELAKGTGTVKDFTTSEQVELPVDAVVNYILEKR